MADGKYKQMSGAALEDYADEKIDLLKEFVEMEPPKSSGGA